jgi:hypothetical protein
MPISWINSPLNTSSSVASALVKLRYFRRPPAGTILTRLYKGTTVHVRVLEHGFVYEGTIYPSLSAVAKAITGLHCSGHLITR